MRMRCPVCQNAVDVPEGQRTQVSCPSCGASIWPDPVVPDGTIDHEAPTLPPSSQVGAGRAPGSATPEVPRAGLDHSPPARRDSEALTKCH